MSEQSQTIRQRIAVAWDDLDARFWLWRSDAQRFIERGWTRLWYRLRGQQCAWRDCHAFADCALTMQFTSATSSDTETLGFCDRHVREVYRTGQITLS